MSVQQAWHSTTRTVAIGRRRSLQRRSGFTILELIVVMAILALLVSVVLPAVQQAREAARRVQCANNLRQIGTALFAYHGTFGGFPPGWIERGEPAPGWGWASMMLPQIEHAVVGDRIHFEVPVGDHRNDAVRVQRIALFVCPSDYAPERFWLYEEDEEHEEEGMDSVGTPQVPSDEKRLFELASANYVGVFGIEDPDEVPGESGSGAFLGDRTMRMANFVDGLSQSLLVGERTGRQLPSTWVGMHPKGEEGPARVVGLVDLSPNNPNADECELSSRHPGGVQFVAGDGRVVFLSENIDRAVYRRMATRSDRLITDKAGDSQ